MKVTLRIKDDVLRGRDDIEMVVHDIKRIANIKKKDPLQYSYIQDPNTDRLSKVRITFNIRNDDILSELKKELDDYIFSIHARRGNLELMEDVGTDFD